jgi:formylglycine-generating enzyme required for sulfatase activity
MAPRIERKLAAILISASRMVANCGDCSRRVLRGGSWDDGPMLLRSAVRDRGYPNSRSSFAGFRVARTLH